MWGFAELTCMLVCRRNQLLSPYSQTDNRAPMLISGTLYSRKIDNSSSRCCFCCCSVPHLALWGHRYNCATVLNEHAEVRSCVKVEVDVLGYGFCGRKATLQQPARKGVN